MTDTTYRPMTRAELENHKTGSHGRDYSVSDNGYDDMNQAAENGWVTLPCWGRDGWDLGNWPYVSFQIRDGGTRPGRPFEMQIITEGDHDQFAFPAAEDRDRAIDYLFLWYAADHRWAPLSYDDRDRLDRGELDVDARFRGRYQG